MAQPDDAPWYDADKVDEFTLALLYLVASPSSEGGGARAWKGFEWETMNRLHAKGLISSPRSKSLSVRMTAEAYQRSKELFHTFFAAASEPEVGPANT
jgi:hypothetical protein